MRANVGVMRKGVRRKGIKVKRRAKFKPKVGFVKEMGDYPQSGSRKSLSADRKRKAMGVGYRISKSGNLYYETRKNMSDRKGSKI